MRELLLVKIFGSSLTVPFSALEGFEVNKILSISKPVKNPGTARKVCSPTLRLRREPSQVSSVKASENVPLILTSIGELLIVNRSARQPESK